MFFSKLVLRPKEALAKLWQAAHALKKLSKQALMDTDIDSSAKSIENSDTYIWLF